MRAVEVSHEGTRVKNGKEIARHLVTLSAPFLTSFPSSPEIRPDTTNHHGSGPGCADFWTVVWWPVIEDGVQHFWNSEGIIADGVQQCWNSEGIIASSGGEKVKE